MGKVDTVGVHSLVSENSSLTFSMYVLYSKKKKKYYDHSNWRKKAN